MTEILDVLDTFGYGLFIALATLAMHMVLGLELAHWTSRWFDDELESRREILLEAKEDLECMFSLFMMGLFAEAALATMFFFFTIVLGFGEAAVSGL